MKNTIDYGNLMHDAMRGLIQKVLQDISDNGLPGDHHFFITFDTLHEDVAIAGWLTDRYPEEMTIVVQNWFENLDVTDQGFSITLNFGDKPEPLYIPYDALKSFVDPSVEFGLRFEPVDSDNEVSDEEPAIREIKNAAEVTEPKAEKPVKSDADIVSLDSFRK